MKIQEIKDKRIKIGKTSITVLDERGKTCGIVRGISTFKNLQPNRQLDFFSKIRNSGIWGAGLTDRVIIDGDDVYFLFDLKPIKIYKEFEELAMAHGTDFSGEQKHYNERLKVKEQAQANGITVIDCFIC